MSELPSISGRDAVRAFEKDRFAVVRVAGSHHIMKKDQHPNLLSVPVHRGQKLKLERSED